MMRSSERPQGSTNKKQRLGGEFISGLVVSDGSTPTSIGATSLDDDEVDSFSKSLRMRPKEIRPQGTKATKLKRAQAASAFDAMNGFLDKYYKRQELKDQEMSRGWSLREQSVSVKKNLAEYFLKKMEDKETYAELEAMKMETSGMNDIQKEFWRLHQETILAKWKAQGKFGLQPPASTPTTPSSWQVVYSPYQPPALNQFSTNGQEGNQYGGYSWQDPSHQYDMSSNSGQPHHGGPVLHSDTTYMAPRYPIAFEGENRFSQDTPSRSRFSQDDQGGASYEHGLNLNSYVPNDCDDRN